MNKKIAFHSSKNYIIGGILYGIYKNDSRDIITEYLQERFRLSKEEADLFVNIVLENVDIFLNPPNVYVASAPEAVIYWYLRKYVDRNTCANYLTLKGKDGFIGKYDLNCEYNGRKWIVEFDSMSQHLSEEAEEKDIKKNLLAIDNGYTVIRIRNMDLNKGQITVLKDLPYCINLNGYFIYSKERVGRDNQCLHDMLLTITGNTLAFEYDNDLTTIACMPYYFWKT